MAHKIVDQHGLHEFLMRLGQCYIYPGILYLVGGSSLLLVAAKESTFDIDLKFEVDPKYQAEFVRCLRQLSRELEMPVEEVSPEEFIPLPQGYQNRRRFVERFGALDVFLFDFYSVALSKLQRGTEKDYADVVSMIEANTIDLISLEQYFQEILPQIELYSLRADPQDFKRKFGHFKMRLGQSP